jgi:hypothetical protein
MWLCEGWTRSKTNRDEIFHAPEPPHKAVFMPIALRMVSEHRSNIALLILAISLSRLSGRADIFGKISVKCQLPTQRQEGWQDSIKTLDLAFPA